MPKLNPLFDSKNIMQMTPEDLKNSLEAENINFSKLTLNEIVYQSNLGNLPDEIRILAVRRLNQLTNNEYDNDSEKSFGSQKAVHNGSHGAEYVIKYDIYELIINLSDNDVKIRSEALITIDEIFKEVTNREKRIEIFRELIDLACVNSSEATRATSIFMLCRVFTIVVDQKVINRDLDIQDMIVKKLICTLSDENQEIRFAAVKALYRICYTIIENFLVSGRESIDEFRYQVIALNMISKELISTTLSNNFSDDERTGLELRLSETHRQILNYIESPQGKHWMFVEEEHKLLIEETRDLLTAHRDSLEEQKKFRRHCCIK